MLKLCLLIVYCGYALMLVEEEFSDISNTEIQSRTVFEKNDETDNMDYERRKEIVKQYLERLNEEKNDWVDPYEMLSRNDHESLSPEIPKETIIQYENKPVVGDVKEAIVSSVIHKEEAAIISNDSNNLFSNHKPQICIPDGIYISRWLKMLIAKIETGSFFEPNALVIPLNSDSLSELKIMSAETVDIRELDEIVTNLVSKATVTSKEEYNWMNFLSSYVLKLLVLIAVGLFVYLFIICLINRPIWTMVCCFIVISVFWHWMQLYYKQVAYKHSLLSSTQTPSECRKNDFNLLESINEYFKSFFTSSDCSKYYEALMVDPIWKVSVSVAFSETITAMLVQPLNPLGKALNGFTKQLFDGLSLLHSFILVMFLFLAFIMLFNYRVRFPWFMGALEPCPPQRNYVEDVKPYKSIDAVGNVIQNVEKADCAVSDMLQHELHKALDDVSPKNSLCDESVISEQESQKICKFIPASNEDKISSELVIKECDKVLPNNPLKLNSTDVSKSVKSSAKEETYAETLPMFASKLSELTDSSESVKNNEKVDICNIKPLLSDVDLMG